jgi:CheY-like chemotaxis protein
MSRILLADDSPHAQRMGERILREEGFEVVSLTDGNAAMLRLADVDPDLILADVFLPGKSGFDLCRHVKSDPRFKHVRVVLTAGLLEPFDEEEAKRAGCDAILKKPFEASKVVSTIDPLVKEAQLARGLFADVIASAPPAPEPPQLAADSPKPADPPAPPVVAPEVDPERVRAAITLALDASLPAMIQEITERVLIALGH